MRSLATRSAIVASREAIGASAVSPSLSMYELGFLELDRQGAKPLFQVLMEQERRTASPSSRTSRSATARRPAPTATGSLPSAHWPRNRARLAQNPSLSRRAAGLLPDATWKKVVCRCRSDRLPFDAMMSGILPHSDATIRRGITWINC